MDEVVKIVGIGLVATIIIIILKQYKPEFALYVSLIAGMLILFLVLDKLAGVINILTSLSDKASINTQFLGLILKMTGIAILIEYGTSICKDAGEQAIASKVELGGKIIIVAMSIPIISLLLETIIKILP